MPIHVITRTDVLFFLFCDDLIELYIQHYGGNNFAPYGIWNIEGLDRRKTLFIIIN